MIKINNNKIKIYDNNSDEVIAVIDYNGFVKEFSLIHFNGLNGVRNKLSIDLKQFDYEPNYSDGKLISFTDLRNGDQTKEINIKGEIFSI